MREKYFFQLENKRQSQNSISKLLVNNTLVTSDKKFSGNVAIFIKTFTLPNKSTWTAKTGFYIN